MSLQDLSLPEKVTGLFQLWLLPPADGPTFTGEIPLDSKDSFGDYERDISSSHPGTQTSQITSVPGHPIKNHHPELKR